MSYPIYGLNDRLQFGKYIDRRLSAVIDVDVEYIKWLLDTVPTFKITPEARQLYEKILKREGK